MYRQKQQGTRKSFTIKDKATLEDGKRNVLDETHTEMQTWKMEKEMSKINTETLVKISSMNFDGGRKEAFKYVICLFQTL